MHIITIWRFKNPSSVCLILYVLFFDRLLSVRSTRIVSAWHGARWFTYQLHIQLSYIMHSCEQMHTSTTHAWSKSNGIHNEPLHCLYSIQMQDSSTSHCYLPICSLERGHVISQIPCIRPWVICLQVQWSVMISCFVAAAKYGFFLYSGNIVIDLFSRHFIRWFQNILCVLHLCWIESTTQGGGKRYRK